MRKLAQNGPPTLAQQRLAADAVALLDAPSL
eukprot:CAMPEP_0183388566 /NCGR_PEP_ID=MMETSP0370-20130417/4193_1 /TAXON_ID=268820 /ORGANISM="Peridinium aciculiferum, Strain PAER-2" /LENGTH=30 /DNA_ID= /DNA_START= /DNA_END= /DNA_ORIENTATION=